MNLFLRLLYVLWRTRFCKKKLAVLETSVIRLSVFPNDLDIYGHMNNGRYQTLLDLGRIDWILRTGLGQHAGKKGWNPLVASVRMKYKKSLRLFQSFEIHTRILGWDEKWFYIEQVFRAGNVEYASGMVKGLFRGRKGNVPTRDVLGAISAVMPSPFLPESLATL